MSWHLLALPLLLLAAQPAAAQHETRSARVEEADGTLTLVQELVIAAPMDRVWHAISTVEGWKSWAVPAGWRDADDPDVIETSYDPQARPGAPQNIRQRFLARIPGRMLAFKTIKAPAGFAELDAFLHMHSVFELADARDGRTHVRLTGVGYPRTASGTKLLGFFEQANATTLDKLRASLEPPSAGAEKSGERP